MTAEVRLDFLQDMATENARKIRILRRALFHAKSQLAVLQILNPNLRGNAEIDMTIEIIQRAMRFEEVE